MSGKSWLVAGALVFGFVGSGVAYLGFQTHARADGTRIASSARSVPAALGRGRDVERLRGELALMQGEVAALRERVTETKAAEPNAATAAPAATDTLAPEALREQREASSQRWKEHMLEVAAAFEQEAPDRNFATTAKAAVELAAQSDPVLQKAAGDVDCRSQTCRVEIHDGKNNQVSHRVPSFLRSLRGTLRRAQADYVDAGNGQMTLVLYLTNQEPVAQMPAR